jgi:hypothetical protein
MKKVVMILAACVVFLSYMLWKVDQKLMSRDKEAFQTVMDICLDWSADRQSRWTIGFRPENPALYDKVIGDEVAWRTACVERLPLFGSIWD